MRVNQVGYSNGEIKQAVLMATGAEKGATFNVINTSTGKSVYKASIGASSTFPDCMQHQVANLAGSLNGDPPVVPGATVDGPNSLSSFQGLGIPGGARKCPPNGGDPFKVFTGKGARYLDNVTAWPSTEPADDYTALSILVFAQQVSGR